MQLEPFRRSADRVCIIGFCQPHREWVPYEETNMEWWGLNRGYIFQHRADRWFEMHGEHIYRWETRRPGNHMIWLERFPGPVYMHQAVPEIPNSVTYPLQEVADDLGSHVYRFLAPGKGQDLSGRGRPYLTSTIAQQIALAIHLEYREIRLYGIDLNTSSEYAWQKPGVEYMLGVAAGRGISVYVPDECPLLAGEIYGRGYMRPEGEHVGPEQWMERINALKAQQAKLERNLNESIGGRRSIEWVIAQMVPGLDHEAMDQRRQSFDGAVQQLKGQLLQCVGALQEVIYWAHQTPAGQDPREALAQLIVEAAPPNGHLQDEGPMEVEATLMDVASGSNTWLIAHNDMPMTPGGRPIRETTSGLASPLIQEVVPV